MTAVNRANANIRQPAQAVAGQQQNGRKVIAAVRSKRLSPQVSSRRSWRFVLIVDREPDHTRVRSLGPGATLLREPFESRVKIRFDWPARTQAEAIVAGIGAVEAAGLRVLRVDNDDWVTAADVGDRVGRSRETVRQWAAGQMGPGGFPPPANPRRDTTFYSWVEVLAWLRERKDLDLPEEQPVLVAADLVVRLRALLPRVPRAGAIVDLLRGPAAQTPGRPPDA